MLAHIFLRPRTKRGTASLFASILMLLLSAGVTNAYSPPKDEYQSQPFMSAAKTSPQVLLVISKDHKMFYQAYNNLADLDDDGEIDNGFNPAITYTGYFDVNSCYVYNSSKARFERNGPTNTTHAQAINPTRPAALANRPDIKVPRSAHGVCTGSSTNGSGTSVTWHGNWLNYIVTSRMDAIRKVLYGGKRSVDTDTETVLSPSFVPRDSHVWGVEVAADNVWADKMRHAPYYDFSLFTAFNKPTD
ncbi:MAG: hypothetical protein LBF22_15530, partial [Deltaproteobacteria bacterium]|nr:hypothetical protein [Deltaproteobacteria bacterium]